MKVPGSFNNMISDSQMSSEKAGTVEVGSARDNVSQRNSTYSPDKVSISGSMSGKDSPSPLTYSGHGMLEVYPANLSVSYVAAHEQRHAQYNRMIAMARGEEVHQTITYSMAFQNGKLIAKGGVTEAEFVSGSNGGGREPIDVKPAAGVVAKAFLDDKKFKLEEKLKELKGGNTGFKSDGKDSNKGLVEETEVLKVKQEIARLSTRISKNDKQQNFKDVQKRNTAKQASDNISIRNISDIATESFKFISERVPNVTLLDGTASAIKVQNTLDELKTAGSPNVFERDISFNPVFLRQKIDSLVNLRDKLAKLEVSATELRDSDSFNIHVPVSSDNDSLSVKTTMDAVDKTYSVTVSRLAANHRVVSDIYSDPFSSLNLSGTFKVNGFEVSVESSNSLYDIMNKINRGEDINNNGTLDLAEDLNGNGSLDVFVLGEGENRRVIYEDVDNNRVLNSSEDINNNKRIDGGSSQNNVRASIENNQLLLTSLNNNPIELVDGGNLLDSIGILTTDAHNNVILKNDIATTQAYTIVNRNPQSANLNVDGNDFSRNVNEISDIVPAITFNVKNTSEKKIKVTISSDVLKSFNIVKNFLDSFNSTIKHINRQLEVKKTMKGNSDVQRIRKNLIDNTTKPVKSLKGGIDSVAKVGIKLENRAKKSFNEITLVNILNKVKGKLTTALSIPSHGSNSVFSNLSDLGIMSEKDDTFSVDEKILKTALRDRPREVFSLFANKNDGIVIRLGGQLADALDLKFGNLSRSQTVLSTLLGDVSSFKKVRKDIQNLQNSLTKQAVTKLNTG